MSGRVYIFKLRETVSPRITEEESGSRKLFGEAEKEKLIAVRWERRFRLAALVFAFTLGGLTTFTTLALLILGSLGKMPVITEWGIVSLGGVIISEVWGIISPVIKHLFRVKD